MMKSQLRAVDNNLPHARDIARTAVAKYRRGTAINPTYDFSAQPKELRQVVYDGTVRFSRRRWYSRLILWR